MLYLHWIVISITCSTSLKVFQFPEEKNNNIRKIKEKRKKTTKPREFLSQSIGLCKEALPPNTTFAPLPCSITHLLTAPLPDPQLNLPRFTSFRLAMLASTYPQIIFLYCPLSYYIFTHWQIS